MSLALWLWRIYWDGTTGCVVRRCVRTILRDAPVIPGVEPFELIDYAPGCCAMIKRRFGSFEEMTSAEAAACRKFLLDEDAEMVRYPTGLANEAHSLPTVRDDGGGTVAAGRDGSHTD